MFFFKQSGLTIFIALLTLAACTREPAAQVEPRLFEREGKFVLIPEQSALRSKLQISAVETRTIEEPLAIPGQIEADPAKLVKINSPVSGRITALHASLGDVVKVGDPLLTMESADVASLLSEVSKANSQLRTAELEYKRQLDLTDAEIAPQRDLEAAELALAQAKSDVTLGRAQLAQLGINSKKPVAAIGRKIIVRAPISGRVVEVTGAAGSYWNDQTQPIMTVADLSQVWFTAAVQEKDLGRVIKGAHADIVLNTYPDLTISGTVFSVGDLLNPDTRTSTARIALNNEEDKYKPAMYGRAIFMARHDNALVVPKTALLQNAFETQVYVEVSPWKFEPRVVKIGLQVGDIAEIVSGLQAGDRIVVKEGVTLND